MKSKLLDKMLKTGSIKKVSLLSESIYFNEKDVIPIECPSLNIAFSGDLDGGLSTGSTVIAGPSRHFKSNLCLAGVRAYFQKYEDAICLFYDSEFGITPEYLKSNGVDPERVIHIPIQHIEMLRADIAQKLEAIERGERVVIFIDSLGNLASQKEIEDALNDKSAADMQRAKVIKSLFRIITPYLNQKDIPLLVVAHVYKTMELYAKDVVSGGTGIMYSCNNAFIIGRSQEKGSDGELLGYNFTINVEKSRTIKEKSKIPLLVTFQGGMSNYSGILDLALESGHVTKPSNGWYQLVDKETGELIGGKVRAKDTETDEFLGSVMKQESFKAFVRSKYQLTSSERAKIQTETELDDLLDEADQ